MLALTAPPPITAPLLNKKHNNGQLYPINVVFGTVWNIDIHKISAFFLGVLLDRRLNLHTKLSERELLVLKIKKKQNGLYNIGHGLRLLIMILVIGLMGNTFYQQPTGPSKQPIGARYLGHVTGYHPIRDQYFLVRSVPAA